MSKHSGGGQRRIKSVDNAFRIISALHDQEGSGVTALANRVDMSKGSVHTYLSTLKSQGVVTENDGEYRLGLHLLELGEFAKRQNPVYQCAQDPLEEIATETGELARLVVKEQGYGVYLSKAEGENAIETTIQPGQREYLHCTSQGKAILAHLSEADVHDIVEEHGLPARTEDTITDIDELFDDLETIRDRGVAFSRSEVTRGMRCVASPVHAPDGNVVAAIGVCGPMSRLQGDRFRDEIPELVKNAANIVEINIQMRHNS
ncbi:IclR family transcriptional regulator [Natrarchaeobius halalkaliphilus]|uniref:IclR family transcriptional regulator n=1 Tax=Natrarchaeobius halalkaliphilus TaxID=1679091 RepID=A0A3N6LYC6_9EURY|nr:IclR family transcriptional regulator [Natrarchaeobius halalkaliphilus]RQG86722.1 IclR family transcriptional regulator [Natrarchaeobius halalkaliphilus]